MQERHNSIYHTQQYPPSPLEAELIRRIKTDLKTAPPVNKTEEALYDAVEKLLKKYKTRITDSAKQTILYHIKASILGWGKLEPLREDEDIEDISCVGWEYPLYIYHRTLRDVETDIRFDSAEELDHTVALFAQKAGKQISLANPILDATLEDGSRIQLTFKNVVSPRGSTFTIRKFRKTPYSVIDLIKNHTFTVEEMVFLWFAVEYNRSILIIGGTASGKTTTLNAITQFIPPLAKIVTLEDTGELMLCHGNWQPSVVPPASESITLFDLVTASMRQRPEYLIVGEVRGKETTAMFQAINTGHTSFSTFHAGDFRNAVNRLENPPLNIPQSMIESLDIVLSQKRFIKGEEQIRRCTEILEIIGQNETNTVFSYREGEDTAVFSGLSQTCADICSRTGMNEEALRQEAERRKAFLLSLLEADITDFREVAAAINAYRRSDEEEGD